MKRIILVLSCLIAFASCQKTPVANTATVETAGQWYVQTDLCEENGTVIAEDCYGIGNWLCLTHNTAANKATEMYINDLGNFWDFKVKLSVDPANKSFKTEGIVANEAYESKVSITNGKITINGATTPSGMKADAIEFVIAFDDDEPGTYYKIHGYRYTGLAADD